MPAHQRCFLPEVRPEAGHEDFIGFLALSLLAVKAIYPAVMGTKLAPGE
jgi:hypothetical protein